MTDLKNHPGFWLRADAAATYDAFEDKYGVQIINSAGRTEAEQQELINMCDRGVRPPVLYYPARPASTSPHVRDGGIAVDMAAGSALKDQFAEFGFQWYGSSDPVHYNFTGWSPSGDGGFVPARDVADVQRIIGADPDRIYGPDTRAKVAAKQRELGVADDGLWGPATEAAYVASQQSSRPSSKSAGELTSADIQEALTRKGYNLFVDNDWGPVSSAALADFQAKNGLTVDRIVGPLTWAKLNS